MAVVRTAKSQGERTRQQKHAGRKEERHEELGAPDRQVTQTDIARGLDNHGDDDSCSIALSDSRDSETLTGAQFTQHVLGSSRWRERIDNETEEPANDLMQKKGRWRPNKRNTKAHDYLSEKEVARIVLPRKEQDADLDEIGKRRRAEDIARGNAARMAATSDLASSHPKGADLD